MQLCRGVYRVWRGMKRVKEREKYCTYIAKRTDMMDQMDQPSKIFLRLGPGFLHQPANTPRMPASCQAATLQVFPASGIPGWTAGLLDCWMSTSGIELNRRIGPAARSDPTGCIHHRGAPVFPSLLANLHMTAKSLWATRYWRCQECSGFEWLSFGSEPTWDLDLVGPHC